MPASLRPAPKWRLYRNYIFLVPVFVISLIYQGAVIATAITGMVHPKPTLHMPFAAYDREVQMVSAEAERAGLHKGDRILMFNGRPLTNIVPMLERSERATSEPMQLQVAGPDGRVRDLTIPVRVDPPHHTSAGDIAIGAVVLFMSLGFTLIGMYVAIMMPYDLRAIIVFGILVSLSHVVSTGSITELPRGLWGLAFTYRAVAVSTWPFWFVLFGLHFPQPLQPVWRRRSLYWIIIGLTSLATFNSVVELVRPYFNLDFMSSLPRIDGRIVAAVAIAFLFASLNIRLRGADPDTRRRLRILLAGATAGLIPLGLVVLYQATSAHSTDSGTALIVIAILLFFLFPISLAYAVLADRAMRVRVVLRQGIRYALAKGGVRVLVAVIIGLLGLSLWNITFGLVRNPNLRLLVFTIVVLVAGFFMRRAGRRVQLAIDKRFFRDAYNAEQVLEDLSRKVVRLVREDELIPTVSKRIAETLHIQNLTVLLDEGDGAYRPVYAMGLDLDGLALPHTSATVQVLKESEEPPLIYADRRDSWIHELPDHESQLLRDLKAQVLLPVEAQDKLLGVFSLGPKRSEEPYTKSDIHLLSSVMAQTALALENSRLTSAIAAEAAQRERLNREMEIAREVQERLFPQQLPCVQGADYAGACRPALGVGGDYYDFLPLADGQLGIAIGDVSGKGIAAALLMASLQASLRGQVMSNPGDLARVMANINRLVYDATPINRYATFFYGQFNPATHLVHYVNAGHNPPFIIRKRPGQETIVLRLDTGGPVVGLLPHAPYQQGTVILEPGDVFVGYTDGVSESMNFEEQEWGEDRLIQTVAERTASSANDLIRAVLDLADEFAAGAPQHDDMTLVAMRVL